MLVIQSPEQMKLEVERARGRGTLVGLVPTMGFFHEGHLSLMRRARSECGLVIVSLFVNPTQFGPAEDLARYPRNFERDCELAARECVDVMYAPGVEDVYGGNYSTFITVEGITETLCGVSRPGHFRGVATVVAKLFQMCRPHRAYFGLKDFQQVRVIETMIRDLNFDVELARCPIVRGPDGLAMSSRNSYLSPEERAAATVLWRSLLAAGEFIGKGEQDGPVVARRLRGMIEAEPLARVDYADVVDPVSLKPLPHIGSGALLAVAVYFGRTRLIDNLLVEREPA